MASRDPFASFPRKVRASTERSARWYVRLPGFFAVHGEVPPALAPSVAFVLGEEGIAVCRGEPDPREPSVARTTLTPVYALEGGGPPAVPTGLVFLRFAEGVPIAGRQAALARAGYAVTEALPYAPHAGWVRAADGGIGTSLAGITALETLPDIITVEPQMLMRSERR